MGECEWVAAQPQAAEEIDGEGRIIGGGGGWRANFFLADTLTQSTESPGQGTALGSGKIGELQHSAEEEEAWHGGIARYQS